MALITDKTQIKLISKLSGTSSFNASDLLLLQRGFKSYKFNYSDLVSALPDGSTLETSSNKLGIKDLGISTGKLANNSVNFSKMQDIDASSTKKVIGKMSGNGDPEEVDVITDLVNASNSNIPTGSAVTTYVNNISNKPNFVTLAGGTINLEQYSGLTTPKVYNISDFTGGGIDNNNIIGIYVEAYAFGSAPHSIWIKALFPDGNHYNIIESHGDNGDDDCGNGAMIYIPIAEGQSTISFFSNANGRVDYKKKVGFSLIAVAQM